MTVWKQPHTADEINQLSANTIIEALGIKITEVGADFITGTMPVDARTKQPYGLLHGGASVTLAETLGTFAGIMSAPKGKFCVGLDINANHTARATDGIVTGIARPQHIGGKTQVWEIKITNESGKLVCVSRITLAVLEKD